VKTLTYTDRLTIIECGECHVTFAMPEDMHRWRKRDGRNFWCPNGCRIYYYENENAKLRAEVASLEGQVVEERRRAEHERRRAAALKGWVTRARRHVGAGICPVGTCRRHFPNLARHMETVHPTWREDDA